MKTQTWMLLLAATTLLGGAGHRAWAQEAAGKAAGQSDKAAVAEANAVVWLDDFAAAQAKARELKRPILADFSGSDWCGWCIRLEKEVFSQAAFKKYAQANVVLFLADFPRRKVLPANVKAQNEKLAAKYGVEGFPTVLLLDAEGQVLAQTGYQAGGAEAYVKHLQELVKAPPAAAQP
ncbi:MAG: thioredoxin family protein [Kiritimatiellae bacterium]|nr:thioredoxin family protein [Kiritimatiellia bacterium]